MRIIQLSDIHLSSSNITDLKSYYLESLIQDLTIFNNEIPIDLILLTGDLLDKGGTSFSSNGYQIFKDDFITPLLSALNLTDNNILFIPGNHDIDRNLIDEENEFYLLNKLTHELANERLIDTQNKFDKINNRIKKFKEFEKQFHEKKTNYVFSNNESLSIEIDKGYKIGFALINDSWRCSNELKKEQHFIGTNQLLNANRYFKTENTDLNLAIFHHPLEAINEVEKEAIENILTSLNFDIAIFGHSHKHKFESIISSNGGIVFLNGRSAFYKPEESDSKFQPGYHVLDIDVKKKSYTLSARKFIHDGFRFDKDTDSLVDGIFSGTLDKKVNYIPLNTNSNNIDDELPTGYSADVDRIVKLLIGKSLYPNPYIFARELIQNSVDACHRAQEINTHLIPQIVVNINIDENYFEVTDEGDGMTKKILKDHFAIIGKSISQEFNDSNGNFNLISKFGIGFISTFIVAQKVYIATRSDSDEPIQFEITDVFKGFNYNISSANGVELLKKSGTKVRVYLKRGHHATQLFGLARSYCRHISNIKFFVNSTEQKTVESWNTENGLFFFNEKNSKYEVRLSIGLSTKHIVSSNSGFLISGNSPALIPFKFPYVIGGEVNFAPKSIDFDISRSNIIETEKSKEFRKEISVSVRYLFRLALESENVQMKAIVLSYLQSYLCFYDANYNNFTDSYINFYSKKELIDLCLEHLNFQFMGWLTKLSSILNQLKIAKINVIYISEASEFNDHHNIVSKYLSDKGNFIVIPTPITALFREGQPGVTTFQLLQIIAEEYGFILVEINNVQVDVLKEMKIDKQQIPTKIIEQVSAIESEEHILINIANFSKTFKPIIKFQNEYFINYEHQAFQSLMKNFEQLASENIKTYFLGLMGLGI